MVGFPSVGKSSLLTTLTGTKSEVASYEFTTLTCIPGTIHYRGSRIQLLDMPGIIEGAKDGKGRGRQVIGTARTCDVILIVLDAAKPLTHKKLIEKELEGFGIRLNKRPPNVVFTRKEKGGISFRSTHAQTLDDETVKAICSEYRIHNAEVQVRQPNLKVDELIDVIEGKNIVYMPVRVRVGGRSRVHACTREELTREEPSPPIEARYPLALTPRHPPTPTPQCLYVLNKIDSISIEELELLDRVPHYVPVSARHLWGFDDLLEKIWQYVGMVRIYTKPRGQIPDYNAPVILSEERRSVEDCCIKIHRTLVKQLKYAWVWGASVKHQPQRVGKDHVLADEDVLQLVKRTG